MSRVLYLVVKNCSGCKIGRFLYAVWQANWLTLCDTVHQVH